MKLAWTKIQFANTDTHTKCIRSIPYVIKREFRSWFMVRTKQVDSHTSDRRLTSPSCTNYGTKSVQIMMICPSCFLPQESLLAVFCISCSHLPKKKHSSVVQLRGKPQYIPTQGNLTLPPYQVNGGKWKVGMLFFIFIFFTSNKRREFVISKL